MDLESKPSLPDNAENCFKCQTCGNMLAVTGQSSTCDICGAKLELGKTPVLGASNEDY